MIERCSCACIEPDLQLLQSPIAFTHIRNMRPATRSQTIHQAVAVSIQQNPDVIDASAIKNNPKEEGDSFEEACTEDHISALQDSDHQYKPDDVDSLEASLKQAMSNILKKASAEIIVEKTHKNYEQYCCLSMLRLFSINSGILDHLKTSCHSCEPTSSLRKQQQLKISRFSCLANFLNELHCGS